MSNPHPSHKFPKGHKLGNTGQRFFSRQSAKLRAQMFKTIRDGGGIEKAVKALARKAEDGDVAACALLFKYIVPEQPKEINKRSLNTVTHDVRIISDPIARDLAANLERQLARNADLAGAADN